MFQMAYGRQKGERILGQSGPTYVENTGTTYIGEAFNFSFKPYKNEETTFRLISGGDGNAFDQDSHDIMSNVFMAATELHLPKRFDQMKQGDKFRFGSTDWTVDYANVSMGSGSMKIHASDGSTLVFQHGKSLNLAVEGDLDFNNKVAIGKIDDANTGNAIAFDPSSKIITIHDEDSFNGAKFAPDISYTLTKSLGGAEFTFSKIETDSLQMSIDPSVGTMQFVINGKTVSKKVIQVSCPDGKVGVGNTVSDTAYFVPSEGIMLMPTGYTPQGYECKKFQDDVVNVYGPQSTTPLQIFFDSMAMQISLVEQPHPKAKNVTSMLTYIETDGGFLFKPNKNSPDVVHYSGSQGWKDLIGMPAYTERGSLFTHVGATFQDTEDTAVFNYANDSTQCQWSVKVEESPLSVRDIGKISAITRLSIYPNPAIGDFAHISFTLPPSGGYATIRISDVEGNRVATPVNNEQRFPGENSVLVPLGNLSAGDYYVTLSFGGEEQTRIMSVKK